MFLWFHKLSSPSYFYRFSGTLIVWFAVLSVLLLGAGLIGGLVLAPPDYQQGESYRIIFIHVPSAWMSMFVYAVMAVASPVHV